MKSPHESLSKLLKWKPKRGNDKDITYSSLLRKCHMNSSPDDDGHDDDARRNNLVCPMKLLHYFSSNVLHFSFPHSTEASKSNDKYELFKLNRGYMFNLPLSGLILPTKPSILSFSSFAGKRIISLLCSRR